MSFFNQNKKPKKESEDIILPFTPEEIYSEGVLALQDIIAPAALEINSNYIRLGTKIAKTLFVVSYPRFLAMSWFSPIINLDRVFDISIFIVMLGNHMNNRARNWKHHHSGSGIAQPKT